MPTVTISRVDPPPVDLNSRIGNGYTPVDGKWRDWAFLVDEQTVDRDDKEECGTTFGFFRVTSQSDLYRKLSISISASFKSFSGSVSGSLSWTRSMSISQRALSLLITVRKVVHRDVLRTFTPTNGAMELLNSSKLEDFARIYGDRFCSSVLYGGDLWLSFDFSSLDTSEQEALNISMEGKYGGFKAAASMSQIFSLLTLSEKIQLRLAYTGADVAIPDFSGLKGSEASRELEKFALQTFPSAVSADSAAELGWELKAYRNVHLGSDAPAPLLLDAQMQRIEDLVALKDTVELKLEEVAEVRQRRRLYKYDEDALRKKEVQLYRWLDDIETAASRVMNYPERNPEPAPAIDLTLVEPIAVKIAKAGVPLSIGVGAGQWSDWATEDEWAGNDNNRINWLQVAFAEPRADVSIECQVGFAKGRGLQGWNIGADAWHVPGKRGDYRTVLVGVKFRLTGPGKDAYDIVYDVRGDNLAPFGEQRNEYPVGIVMNTRVPSINCIRYLKVRVVPKGQ